MLWCLRAGEGASKWVEWTDRWTEVPAPSMRLAEPACALAVISEFPLLSAEHLMLHCSQMFSRSHELRLGGNKANMGMSGNEIPVGLWWNEDQTPRFSLWDRKGSDDGYQIGLHPELTQLTTDMSGRSDTSGLLITAPFQSTLRLTWPPACPPGISLGWFISPGTSFTFHIARPIMQGELIHEHSESALGKGWDADGLPEAS